MDAFTAIESRRPNMKQGRGRNPSVISKKSEDAMRSNSANRRKLRLREMTSLERLMDVRRDKGMLPRMGRFTTIRRPPRNGKLESLGILGARRKMLDDSTIGKKVCLANPDKACVHYNLNSA